jgi:hypothetical protein
VRFEGVNDGADDLVREKVLSSNLDDARRCPSARGEDRREVQVVRDDDEAVFVRPRQDFGCGSVVACSRLGVDTPIVDQRLRLTKRDAGGGSADGLRRPIEINEEAPCAYVESCHNYAGSAMASTCSRVSVML